MAHERDRDPSLTERRVFGPVYDELWAGWAKATGHLQDLSDAELWHAAEWANNLGRTNCGWLVYQMKWDLVQFIAWEQNRREKAKVERTEKCDPGCYAKNFAGHRRPCPSADQDRTVS